MKKAIKIISMVLIITLTIQVMNLQGIFLSKPRVVNATENLQTPESLINNNTQQAANNQGETIDSKGENNSQDLSSTIFPTIATLNGSSIEGDIENPTAPTDLVVVAKSDVSISMMWNPSTDNIGVIAYDIYDGQALIGTTINTSYKASDLKANSQHSFTVKARDARENQSIASNILTVTTDAVAVLVDKEAPTAPTNFSLVSKTVEAATVSWYESIDNVGVKDYIIYNDGVKVGKTTERNFKIEKLTPNTTYEFTVRAEDEGGNVSQDSNVISVTTDVDNEAPTVPTSFAVMSKTSTSITFTWNKSQDNAAVNSYDIFEGIEKVGNAEDNIYTITGIVPNTTHSYKIKAKDISGNISAESAELAVTTVVDTENPTTPMELKAISKTSTSVQLSWIKSSDNVGILGYDIYEGIKKIGETTGETTFLAEGLTPNTSYHFIIKAKDGAGNVSLESTILSITTDEKVDIIVGDEDPEIADDFGNDIDSAHEINVGVNNAGIINYEGDCDLFKFTINESGIYRIGVSNNVSNPGTLIDSSNNITSGIKDLNGSYKYTLKAGKTYYLNISGGAVNSKYTVLLDVVTFKGELTSKTISEATIRWSEIEEIEGITNFEIYRDGVKIGTVSASSNSYTDKNLHSGSTYNYIVKALDATGKVLEGSNSVEVTMELDEEAPKAPSNISVKCTGILATYLLSWYGATDNGVITEYDIYCDGVEIGSTSDTYFKYKIPSYNKNYLLTVKTKDSGNNYSNFSSEIVLNSTLTNVEIGATINGKIDYAGECDFYSFVAQENSFYRIQSSGSSYISGYLYDENGQVLKSNNDSGSYYFTIIEKLEAGKRYFFGIKPYHYYFKNATYQFNILVVDKEKPTVPTELQVTNKTQSTATITWSTSTDNIGVNSYKVYRDGIMIATLSGTQASYTDINLYSGVTYKYVVKAADLAGNISEPSNEIITTMAVDENSPTAPTNIIVNCTGLFQIYLSWSGATDNGIITEYEIYCDGEKIGTTINTNFRYSLEKCDKKYVFTIKSRDSGNNYSEFSRDIIVNCSVKSANLGVKIDGNIDYAEEYDFYSFIAPKNLSFKFESSGDTDVYGFLYDENGQLISSNDDDGDGNNFKIKKELQEGKLYYIGIKGIRSDIGAYSFLISILDTEKPIAPTGLQQTEKTQSTVKISWEASTDNIGVNSYEIYRDGIKIATVSESTRSYTDINLYSGITYKYVVKAVDLEGNISEASNEITTIAVDEEAPTAPTNISIKYTGLFKINLSWSGSIDNGVIKEYEVYCNGEKIGKTSRNNFAYTLARLSQEYTFTIKAKDSGNNFSGFSQEISTYNISAQLELRKDGSIDYDGEYDFYYFVAPKNATYIIESSGNIDLYGYLFDENGQVLGSDDDSGPKYNFNIVKELKEGQIYYIGIRHYGSGTGAYSFLISIVETEKPTAPSELKELNKTDSTITINWTHSIDNIGVNAYDIYRNDVKISTVLGNINTFQDTGLSPNTNYVYKVIARDSYNNCSEYSNEISIKTDGDKSAPTTPSLIQISSRTIDSVNLSWNAAQDNLAVVGYEIYRNGEKIATINIQSYTDQSLLPGTYKYTVKAIDAVGNESGESTAVLYDNELPSKTEVSMVSKTESKITINWVPSTDNVAVAAYDIYRNGGIIAIVLGAINSYEDTELSPNTNYVYKVVAKDEASNYSEDSNEITITTDEDISAPTVPSLIEISSRTIDSVNLTWNTAQDNVAVIGYEIYRNGEKIATVNERNYTDQSLLPGTYRYTIKAIDASGNKSEESTSALYDNELPSKAEVSMLSKTESTITINWAPSTDNIGINVYDIYRNGEKIATVLGDVNSYEDTGLSSNTNYVYKVVAKDEANNYSEDSNETTIMTNEDSIVPTAPTNLLIKYTGPCQILLSWSGASDNGVIDEYDIYYNGEKVGTTTNSFFGYTISISDQQRVFKIKVKDSGNNYSEFSQDIVLNTPIKSVNAGVTISGNIDYAGEYDFYSFVAENNVTYKIESSGSLNIYGYLLDENGNLLKSDNDSGYGYNFIITKELQAGKKYYIAIKNYWYSSTGSYWFNITYIDTKRPSAPTELKESEKTQSTVTITWQPSTDNVAVNYYEIYRDGVKIATISASIPKYTNTGLYSGVTYKYVIKARDTAGNVSEDSNEIAITMAIDEESPIAPTSISISYTSISQIILSWSGFSDNGIITEYEIYCNGEKIGTTVNTNFYYNMVGIGQQNIFKIKAKDSENNCSEFSKEIVSNKVVTPIQLRSEIKEKIDYNGEYDFYSFIAPKNLSFKFESSGNTDLYGCLYDENGQSLGSDDDSGPENNFSIVKELKEGQIYYIGIRHYSSGTGEYNFLISILDTEKPIAPTGLQQTEKTQSTVKISWEASTDNIGVNSYEIYRDGIKIATLSESTRSYTDINLYSGITYKYVVKAVDLEGNISEASNEITTTIAVDEEAPTAPTNISIKYTGLFNINLSWSGSIDNGVITEYEVYCNGEKIGTTSRNNFAYTVARLSQEYTFTIKAKDSGNNFSDFSQEVSTYNISAQLELRKDGSIDYAGEYDYYSFVAPKNATYKIESSGNIDLYGYLFDENGQVLGSNDDAGPELNFSIVKELKEGQIYYIGIRHYSSGTGEYNFLISIVDTEKPTAPSELKELYKTESTITINWAPSTDNIGVSSYTIYRNGVNIATVLGNINTFKDTGLSPNTNYLYKVVAKDVANNDSEYSNEITITTNEDIVEPTVPSWIYISSRTVSSVNLYWNSATDNVAVVAYDIYRNGTKITRVDARSYTDGKLVPGTYRYTVKAIDAAGNESGESTSVLYDNELPSKPEVSMISKTAVAINISWTAAIDNIGVTKYEIYRNNVKIATVTGTTYNDKGLQPDVSYEYYIRAYDAADNFTDSSILLVTTDRDTVAPSKPNGLNIYTKTGKSVTLTWVPSSDNYKVAGYEVYRDGVKIGTTTSTTYKDEGLTTGTLYIYTVKAFDVGGNLSEFSDEWRVVPALPRISRVSPANGVTIGGAGNTDLDLIFTNSGNAIGSKATFEISKDGVNWTALSNISRLNYNSQEGWYTCPLDLTNFESGNYKIRYTFYDEDGEFASTTADYIVDRLAPSIPTNIKAETDAGKIIVTWNPVPEGDVAGYNIYRSDSIDGNYVLIATITNLGNLIYSDENVIIDKLYYYKITAKDKFNQESIASNIVEGKARIDDVNPEILRIEPLEDVTFGREAIITVKAQDNLKLASILLQYSTDEGITWIDIATINTRDNATFKWDTSKINGQVKVRAIAKDTTGNISESDIIRDFTMDTVGPAKVEGLTSISYDTSAIVNWNFTPENDFSYFLVERKDSIDGEYKVIATVKDKRGIKVNELECNKTYWFRVTAYDIYGNKGIVSDEIEVTTIEDKIKPTISSIGPSSNYYSKSINLVATVVDNVGVESITFQVSKDGMAWSDLNTSSFTARSTYATANYIYDISLLTEGLYYIRVVAKDAYGNISNITSAASNIAYRVDHTAPIVPQEVVVKNSTGDITITWSKNQEIDLKYYKVYRALSLDGEYLLAADNLTSLGYCDRNAVNGTTYYYKVSAVDVSGNEGLKSNVVSGKLTEDTEAPKIYSIYPNKGTILGANPSIGIGASDNYKIKQITLEYQDSTGKWITIGNKNINYYYASEMIMWNTSGLTDGTYHLRAFATDESGNISEVYCMDYTLNVIPPTKLDASLTAEGWKVSLSWNASEEIDFAGYRVYRKSSLNGVYNVISNVTSTSYVDDLLTPGQAYYYKIEAVDKYNNSSITSEIIGIPLDIDGYAPKADAGLDANAVVGIEIAFDGSFSSDNVGVKEYLWDFGDGTTATNAQPKHIYLGKGTYTVTLKVKDAAGNESTDTLKVVVYPDQQIGRLNVIVKDEATGATLSNANVYIDFSEDVPRQYYTDSQGVTSVISNPGVYKVSAYKDGYLPVGQDAQVIQYQESTVVINLKKSELVVGNMNVRRMELDEIVAAGIDINASENQFVYSFTVELTFNEVPLPVETYYINGFGGYVGNYKSNSWGWGGSSSGSGWGTGTVTKNVIPNKNHPEIAPNIVCLYIPQSVSWLKEFFEVQLVVQNMADTEFVVEDATATLELPKGVSLAPTREKQSLKAELGDIAGGEKKGKTWIIRGDTEGQYNLQAEFNGILMPFEEPVKTTFKTDSPFTVNGGNGLHIYVTAEETAYDGEPYYVNFQLVNESDRPIYNVSTTFGSYQEPVQKQEVVIINPDGTREVQTETAGGNSYVAELGYSGDGDYMSIPIMRGNDKLSVTTLMPGQYIIGTYVTTFSGNSKEEDVYYVLSKAIVTSCSGNADIPVSISTMPGHMSKYILQVVDESTMWADPINTNTGALEISTEAISVLGASELSFNLEYNSRGEDDIAPIKEQVGKAIQRLMDNGNDENYNSLIADKAFNLGKLGKVSVGKGWSHNYETMLKTNIDGSITVYWSPYSYSFFYDKGTDSINVYGTRDSNGNIILSQNSVTTGQKRTFYNDNMKDYSLIRNEDGSYVLNFANGSKYYFDSNGELSKMVDNTGKYITISKSNNEMIVTEAISGKKLIVKYNNKGLIESASDITGRKTTFVYDENNCLIKIIGPSGKTTQYGYDSIGHLLRGVDGDGDTYLVNTYDDKGRVISQDDGVDGNSLTTLSYDDTTEYWHNIVTITDRNGNTRKHVHNRLGKLIRVEDELGNVTSYTYDSKGNKRSETDPKGNTISYEYDSNGNAISISDAEGTKVTMTYDAAGNILVINNEKEKGKSAVNTYSSNNLLLSTVNGTGTKTNYTYDSNGQLILKNIDKVGSTAFTYEDGKIKTSTDPFGNVTTMEYNNLGLLTSVTDREGNKTSYEYDLLGNKISQTAPNGAKTTYTYDCRGKVLSETDERGNTSTFRYDGNGNLLEATDEYGNKVLYQYDGEDRVTKETDSQGNITETTYDAAGRAVSNTDDLGVVTTKVYDENGLVKSVSTTGKGTINFEYYKNGKMKSVTDAKGQKTTYYYDFSWNLSRVEDVAGNAVTFTYDVSRNVLTKTDPLGNRSEYTYDSTGNVLTQKDPNGNITSYEYNANGKLTLARDALQNTTTYEYDKEGRVVKITNSRGYFKTFTYNSVGLVESVTDELGNTTQVNYDISGNVISAVDANGVEVQKNSYDQYGNLITTTDALGNVATNKYNDFGQLCESINKLNQSTTYEYDKVGRLVKVSDPLKGLSTYTYYDDGNVKTITDPNGNTSTFDYDILGELVKETTPIGSSKTYGYNAIGLLEKTTNGRNQETTYIYDKAGRITSYTDTEGTVSYDYDKNGNVTSVTDKNGTITRVYDALNRVSEYTDFRGNTVKYSYDTCGNLIALTYPGGRIVRYTYNEANSLTNVVDWENHSTNYDYDKNGRLIKTTRPNGTTMEVVYDAAGQVKQQKELGVHKEIITQYDYQYDANGNVKVEQSSWTSGVHKIISSVMTYGVGNKLLTYNGQTMEYDADGNMTYGVLNGKMVHFEYDCRNRLIKAGDTVYEYDAENNRTAVIENGKKTEYVYNPNTRLSQLLIEIDSDGDENFYVYGLGLIGEESNGEYLTYHFDRRGSTVAITDMNSLVTDRFQYGAYGEIISHDGNNKTPFMYNGRDGVITDSNGLYYMRARYYNPEIKRFINQDVVIGNINDGRSLNRYAYVYGNPVDSVDPFGLSPELTSGEATGEKEESGGLLGWVHGALDVVGFIPVIGDAGDLINGVIYAAEGDFANAGLSLIAVVPVVGSFVSKGAKWGAKAFKTIRAGDKFVNAINTGRKIASRTGDAISSARSAVSTAKRVVKSKIDNVVQGAKTFAKQKKPGFLKLGSGAKGAADPKDIHFMQSSIKNQTGSHTVLENAEALKNGTLKASDLPNIKVWKDDAGKMWTLDHRRLGAFKQAGLNEIPIQWATPEEVASQMWKMTTKNGGTSIKLKLGNGESMIIK